MPRKPKPLPRARSRWPARILATLACLAVAIVLIAVTAGMAMPDPDRARVDAPARQEYHGPWCAYWHAGERAAWRAWGAVEAWGRDR